ncbi:MAG: thymidine kinase [Chloroflexi bacterium]|nr:thymidine kinase [Chloroflexota bacterium]
MSSCSPGGRIEVIVGPMFSGKTEELIRRIRRAVIAKQKIQVFKPSIDTRYAADKLTSHNGDQFHAVPVPNTQAMAERIEPDTRVVAVDEAQFFDYEIVQLARRLACRGMRVILAGLDMDFRGEPFPPMPTLMAIADQVDKLQAICMVCRNEATHTQRLINGQPASYYDPIVMVGAQEMYEPRCRAHHVVLDHPAFSDETEEAP